MRERDARFVIVPHLVSCSPYLRNAFTLSSCSLSPQRRPVVAREQRHAAHRPCALFNMATNNLTKNQTYQYRIALADGSYIYFTFGTK